MDKNSLLTPLDLTNRAEVIDSAITNSSESKPEILNLLILILAVVALAFSPIFTKLSESEISPTATIFNRLWLASIIMAVWQLLKNPPQSDLIKRSLLKPDYKQQGLLILASAAATVSSLLWAISFTQTSVASSTVLRSLTPLFISFGAWLVLKQQFNRQFVIGMIVAILGGMLIGWEDLRLGSDNLVGDGIALLSAALHGVNILTIGYLRDRNCDTPTVLLWRCSFGALIMLPIIYFTDTSTNLFPVSPQGWLIVIALAVVCQTFGQGLLVYSLKQFSSSFVGIFTLLKPIFTAFLAWIIFAEDLSLNSAIAVILILIGIYLAKSSIKQPLTANTQ